MLLKEVRIKGAQSASATLNSLKESSTYSSNSLQRFDKQKETRREHLLVEQRANQRAANRPISSQQAPPNQQWSNERGMRQARRGQWPANEHT